MSDDRLNEIKARLEKATPGPWTTDIAEDGCAIDAKGDDIAVTNDRDSFYTGLTIDQCKANADFIAHARADLEWAVAELEKTAVTRDMAQALEDGAAEIERLQSELDEINKDGAGLLEENRRMRDEIKRLRNDNYMLQDTAEEALKYVARLEARLQEALLNEGALFLKCGLDFGKSYVEAEMAKLKDGK